MKKLMLLVLASGLLACSDGKTPSERKSDAGEETKGDGGVTHEDDDAGETAASSGLERAPGALPRPPSSKLPDDLKPPDFAK
jgi:hypothetical protein